MVSKYKSLLKDSFVFAMGSLGSKLILFLLVPLYTNYMTEAEYGTADLVFTAAQLMVPFISVVIFDAVIRYGLSKHEKKENVLMVGLFVFLFSLVLGAAIAPLIGLYQTLAPWKWYLYSFVVGSIFNSIVLNYLKAKGKNKAFALISVIQTGILASLNIWFLVYCSMGIQGYLLAYIIAVIVADIIAFFVGNVAHDLRRATFDKRLFKEMIAYSTPLILNNISWWVIHSSDKFMVEIMISAVALGVYTAAAKIPSLINVFVSIFQQAWGISTVKEIETTNDNGFYSDVFRYLFLFASGCCVFIVAIIKLFMRYYVGKDFQSAWRYIPLLLVSAVFAAVASYYGALYGALRKSVNNMITTVIAALSNLILNALLIPVIGVWGAVVGTVVSYIIIAFARMYDVGRYMNIQIDMSKFLLNCMIIIFQAVAIPLDWHGEIISVFSILAFVLLNKHDIDLLLHKGRSLINEKNRDK